MSVEAWTLQSRRSWSFCGKWIVVRMKPRRPLEWRHCAFLESPALQLCGKILEDVGVKRSPSAFSTRHWAGCESACAVIATGVTGARASSREHRPVLRHLLGAGCLHSGQCHQAKRDEIRAPDFYVMGGDRLSRSVNHGKNGSAWSGTSISWCFMHVRPG